MNYCPHCGVSLPGGAVSFCPQCGEALPQGGERPVRKKSGSRKKRPTHRPAGKTTGHDTSASRNPRPAPNPMDENYDGYYDDVPPIDAGWDAGGLDPDLVKRVTLLILGAISMIALAITLMMLL